MKIVLGLDRNWPISPNFSTTSGPVFTYVSALIDVYMQIINRYKFRSSPRDVAMVTN